MSSRVGRFASVLFACRFVGSLAFARPHQPMVYRRTSGTLSATSVEDYDELPLDFPRRDDVLVALRAVRKASRVANRLQPSTEDGISTVTKTDLSPVTVADFAVQAMVLNDLHVAFSKDSFIAEESSSSLKDEQVAEQTLAATSMPNVNHVKASIDLGKDYLEWEKRGGRPPRVWCLDPIDGTRGFLRGKQEGGQYAIALALLENGVPTIGVLGCPNLPVSASDFNYAWKHGETEENNAATRGCVFVASRDGGCYQLPMEPGAASCKRIQVTPKDESTMKVSEARFCIGVEKYSDALGQCGGMAQVIHGDGALNEEGEIILARRIDSQAKHGVLARAGAEFYVRLPKPGYVEWIWDHAAGNVVVEEAGGAMTDVEGRPIDFSLGPQLSESVRGVLASNGGVFHEGLVDAYRIQEEARPASSTSPQK